MYDALILANGDLPASAQSWQDIPYQHLICTDGAASRLNIHPDYIIGDFDTCDVNHLHDQFPQTHILPDHDQDTTDLEKVLKFCIQQKYNRVLCLGTMGGQADHAAYNLCLLARFSSLNVTYLHFVDHVRQWIFRLPPTLTLGCPVNSLFSFIPYSQASIRSEGLQWELDGQYRQDGPGAVRNKNIQTNVTIHTQGSCLVFITAPHI